MKTQLVGLLGSVALLAASCSSTTPEASTTPLTTETQATLPIATTQQTLTGQTTVTARPTTASDPASVAEGAVGSGETVYSVAVVNTGVEPRFMVGAGTTPELNLALELHNHQDVTVEVEGEPLSAYSSDSNIELDLAFEATQGSDFAARLTVTEVQVEAGENPDGVGHNRATATVDDEKISDPTTAQGLTSEWTLSSDLTERRLSAVSSGGDAARAEALNGIAATFFLLQIPTPKDPLGEGAAWTAHTTTLVDGVPATVDTRATITDINDSVATAEVSITVTYQPELVQLVGSGTSTVSGSTQISGQFTWPGNAPFAVLETVVSSDLNIEVEDTDGRPVAINQLVEQTYSLRLR